VARRPSRNGSDGSELCRADEMHNGAISMFAGGGGGGGVIDLREQRVPPVMITVCASFAACLSEITQHPRYETSLFEK